MNLNSELYIIILWQNARLDNMLEKQVIDDIQKHLNIIEITEIHWTQSLFHSNMSRFYGLKVSDIKHKVEHCGKGPFLLITVLDNNPNYEFRKTSRGTEYVNSNIFDLKHRYRNWTGGGHKIHTTNSVKETNRDITLLLGINYKDYLKLHQSTQAKNQKDYTSISKDLIGANGWNTLTEFFYTLNSCVNYIVLRNYEILPERYDDRHGDIDLLVEDFNEIQLIAGAKKIFHEEYRVHCNVYIGNKDIQFDFRHLKDKYYCRKWQENMLQKKVFYKESLYIPSEEDYFYGLLYHVLIHKPSIHQKNKQPLLDSYKKLFPAEKNLKSINFDDAFVKLLDFLDRNNYTITKPIDNSVFFDTRYLIDSLNYRFVLSKYFITDVKPTQIHLWKNGSQYFYLHGYDKYNKKLFIKYNGMEDSAQVEYEMMERLNKESSNYFLKAYYYSSNIDEKFVAMEYIDGITLDKINYLQLEKSDIIGIIEGLYNILTILHKNNLLHRDIKPSNLIFSKEKKLILIDFQFTVDMTNIQEYLCVQNNPQLISQLGEEYALGRYIWDDAYSMLKLAKFIIESANINLDDCIQTIQNISNRIGIIRYDAQTLSLQERKEITDKTTFSLQERKKITDKTTLYKLTHFYFLRGKW